MGKKGGLFKPPKHKWLAKVVSFEDPKEARKAASKLLSGLKKGRVGKKRVGKKTALAIARALNYAANRAAASTKREGLSSKERRELEEIARIYREAAEEAFDVYREKYK